MFSTSAGDGGLQVSDAGVGLFEAGEVDVDGMVSEDVVVGDVVVGGLGGVSAGGGKMEGVVVGTTDPGVVVGVLNGGGGGVSGVSGGVTPTPNEPWAEWVNLDGGGEGPALLGVEV